jgi:hypothetical protein
MRRPRLLPASPGSVAGRAQGGDVSVRESPVFAGVPAAMGTQDRGLPYASLGRAAPGRHGAADRLRGRGCDDHPRGGPVPAASDPQESHVLLCARVATGRAGSAHTPRHSIGRHADAQGGRGLVVLVGSRCSGDTRCEGDVLHWADQRPASPCLLHGQARPGRRRCCSPILPRSGFFLLEGLSPSATEGVVAGGARRAARGPAPPNNLDPRKRAGLDDRRGRGARRRGPVGSRRHGGGRP